MGIDFDPAVRAVANLLPQVTRLAAPTPCEHYTVADLLDHLDGLTVAFARAARKESGPAADEAPEPDGARLHDEWRERISRQLAELAEAWRDPSAWQGTTKAGGVELTGAEAGMVALTEVVVHGWDLARATGQDYAPEDEVVAAVHDHLSVVAAAGPVDGLFGPAVEVATEAPPLDHVVGLAGRDPAWRPR